MPSQKSKLKKVKSEPVTVVASTPVPIKTEPLDIKPLGAYVDDRVELIRQAFTCLKPKEVKCLVPDFLQGKSIESVKEQCLDEMLGISKKRLLAIINNTRCPTDTESSSDEDEKIIEHISLDEISSDSEVEVAKPAAKKVKPKDIKLKKTKAAETKSNEKPNKNGDKKSEKEMTVLELLELQARARAIRSQLALEPVTKIELDSDQDAENASDTERESRKAAEKTNEKSKPDKTSSAKPPGGSPPKEQPKRVRLKRNFRIRQVGEEDPHEETSQSSIPEQPPARKSRSKSKEKVVESPKTSNDAQQVKPEEEEEAHDSKSRDSSPEVIPLIPSPETLCISSDSEDEKAKKAKSSIFVDNIEELEKQLKETQVLTPTPKPDHKDEQEEGELTEEDKSPQRNRKESVKSNTATSEHTEAESPKKDEHPVASLEQDEELDYEVKEISDSEPETTSQRNDSAKTDKEEAEKAASVDSSESEPDSGSSNDDDKDKSSSDDDDDEDEGDDHDPDVVEIHDSSDETLLEQKMADDEPEKSWGSRWLQSKRVAKVMAASRLGNKVRDNLKEKKKKQKQKQQQEQEEEEARKMESPEPPTVPEVPSNVEVGSVEHYKELVAKAGESASADKEDAEVTERVDGAENKNIYKGIAAKAGEAASADKEDAEGTEQVDRKKNKK